MPKFNDFDLSCWKEYSDIITDSLWIIGKRDNSGAHDGSYHGNFVPQIPHQLFLRYTKKGDWILDPFMGRGTSLIEAQRLERNAVGIELQNDVAKEAYQRILSEKNPICHGRVCVDDSRTVDICNIMNKEKIEKFQFIIFHPPYWDIIKFSDNKNDLSNSETLETFLENFGMVIDNTTQHHEKTDIALL